MYLKNHVHTLRASIKVKALYIDEQWHLHENINLELK